MTKTEPIKGSFSIAKEMKNFNNSSEEEKNELRFILTNGLGFISMMFLGFLSGYFLGKFGIGLDE